MGAKMPNHAKHGDDFSVGDAPLVFLAVLGAVATRAGEASMAVGSVGVAFRGALAMALTTGVGRMFGVAA